MSLAPQKIGILGGGQLAWMLAQAAHEMGHEVYGLVKSLDEPLAHLPYVQLHTPATHKEFALAIDVLCFESEFFDRRTVDNILRINPQVTTRPEIRTMNLLGDKLEQKILFDSLSIAHSEYLELTEACLDEDLETACSRFRQGFVVKRALGGYDGKGNFFVAKPSEMRDLEGFRDFCLKAFAEGSRLYAERRVDFECELALVAVASQAKGEFMTYPLMLTRQVEGACQEVWGPAVPMGIEAEYALQASRSALSLAKQFPDLACYALEFFWDRERGLLLNEMAPRVHNSGHFTQTEGIRSQFHNHIRSLVDDSLLPFNAQGFYLMRNLLAPKLPGLKPVDIERVEALRSMWRGDLQWYGKSHLAPGRKMGHVNLREEDVLALELARSDLAQRESGFWASLEA